MVFGTRSWAISGSDLGKAVKGFKDGVKGEEESQPAAVPPPPQQVADKSTIDVEAREKNPSLTPLHLTSPP